MGRKPCQTHQVKTAVISYIYPKGLIFLQDFLQTLSAQTVQDFELLIFNDGVDDLERFFKDYKKDFTIFPVRGTVVEIRFNSLAVLLNTSFDNFIFQDIDDSMSGNRVEKCRELLQHYPVVCNDLALADEKQNVVATSTWSTRLPEGFEFDHFFIADKNIVGFGNTAIRKTLLDIPIHFHSSPLAADWFIFYQILLLSKAKVVFTAACQTIYRQHINNTAGLKQATEQRLKNVVQVCRQHYTGLIETGYTLLNEQLSATIKVEKLLQQNNYDYNPTVSYLNLYWWEEKNYFYEKN